MNSKLCFYHFFRKTEPTFDKLDMNNLCLRFGAPAQTPSLLTINDDCILELLKYLQIDDQVSLAGTCTRLRMLIQNKYAVNKDKAFVVELTNNRFRLLQNVRAIRLFGGYFKNIRIRIGNDDEEQQQFLFKSLAESCSKSLDYLFILDLQDKLKYALNVLRRAKAIELHLCSNVESYLAECIKCENLSLNGCQLDLRRIKMPKLKTVSITLHDNNGCYTGMNSLLMRHRKLRTIELDLGWAHFDEYGFFDFSYIGRQPELKELNLYCYGMIKNEATASKLTKLSKLHLRCDYGDCLVNILKNVASDSMQQLQITTIMSESKEQVLSCLPRFKKLENFRDNFGMIVQTDRDLALLYGLGELSALCIDTHSITNNGLIGLVKNLTKLKLIWLGFSVQIDSELYVKLLYICKKQNRHVTIYAKLDPKGIPEQFVNDNGDYLTFNQFCNLTIYEHFKYTYFST